ncbi:MAG: hypothetical protein II995_01145 [Oscillospiraceae bacterium]|nr:hypothetical protein [Oscillospiraceae bacterium]
MGKYKSAINNIKAVVEILLLVTRVSFTVLFELPFLYLSEKVLGYTPKWARVSEEPWKDIFCYTTGKDEYGINYIEIYTANGGETNEMTYPIAKDFITKIFSPYHMQVKIESNDNAIEIYNQLLSKHYSEQIFFDKDNGVIYIICDDIKPIFGILAAQSEYFYYFDVCAFANLPHIESYEECEKLMSNKDSLLYIECQKQHDKILLHFDASMFSEENLLNSFRECCNQHNRRFMTSEEMVTLYP